MARKNRMFAMVRSMEASANTRPESTNVPIHRKCRQVSVVIMEYELLGDTLR